MKEIFGLITDIINSIFQGCCLTFLFIKQFFQVHYFGAVIDERKHETVTSFIIYVIGQTTWYIHELILWCTSSNKGPRKTVKGTWNYKNSLISDCHVTKFAQLFLKNIVYLAFRFDGICTIWPKDVCSRGLHQIKMFLCKIYHI